MWIHNEFENKFLLFADGDGDGDGGGGGGDGDGDGDGGGGGGGREAFIATLPEDLRADPSFADIQDVSGLARSYVNGQRLIGADKATLLKIPGENATTEERTEFFTKLGRPEASAGYEFKKPDTHPDHVPYDEELVGGFAEVAHEVGLSKGQGQKLMDWYLENEVGYYDALQKQADDAKASNEASLKATLGEAYDETVNMATETIRQYFGDEFVDYLEETGLGNDPRMILGMGKLGRELQNDPILGEPARQGKMTPEEAKRKIADRQGDPNFMKRYQDGGQPGHDEAVAEMNDLFRAAHPQGNTPPTVVGTSGLPASANVG